MRIRNMLVCMAVFTAALFSANPSWAQGETRFGVWDNADQPQQCHDLRAPPERRHEDHGQQSVQTRTTTWSYVTMFDGKFRPVTGQENSETAVEIINEKSTRIYNKRNGAVYQVVINTLSDDNNTINNEYIRMDKDGKITGVTHVTYIRRKK